MTKASFSPGVLLFCAALISVSGIVSAEEQESLEDSLDRLVREGEKAPHDLGRRIAERIEADPAGSFDAIMARIRAGIKEEKALAAWIWALGLTRDERGAETILGILKERDTEAVRWRASEALSSIGGARAGEYLMGLLEKTADKYERFGLLNLLARMKHAPALPKTEELLKEEWKDFYWRMMFVFGKMGDACVPFLMEKLKDENRTVRYNAVRILGEWLGAPEASQAFRDMYFAEQDQDIRLGCLACAERTTSSLAEMKAFFIKAASGNKSPDETKFAKESLGHITMLEMSMALLRKEKKRDPDAFKKAFDKLWKSHGKSGNWETLSRCSSVDDEPRLKLLRERILLRDSDEAFYDYRRVNEVIFMNRLIGRIPEKPASPAPAPGDDSAKRMSSPRGTVEFLMDALKRKSIDDVKAAFCAKDREFLPDDCRGIDAPVAFELTAEKADGETAEIRVAVETEKEKGSKKDFTFTLGQESGRWLVSGYFDAGERRHWRNPDCNEDEKEVKGGGRLGIEKDEFVWLMPVDLEISPDEREKTAFDAKLLVETVRNEGRFLPLDPVIPDDLLERFPDSSRFSTDLVRLGRSGAWKFPEDSSRSKDLKTLLDVVGDLKGLLELMKEKLGIAVREKAAYISFMTVDREPMFFGLVKGWRAFGGTWNIGKNVLARAFEITFPAPEEDEQKIAFLVDLAAGIPRLLFDPR